MAPAAERILAGLFRSYSEKRGMDIRKLKEKLEKVAAYHLR
jgi:hypothetical protein